MSRTMVPASVVSACVATAAFCAVWLHLGLDQVQQRREHFWLAIAALGIVQLAIGHALIYEAQTPEQAQDAQVLSLMCSGPLVVGLLRFTALMTRSRIWPVELCCGGFAVFVSVTAFLRPDLYLSGPIQQREVAWLGLRFVELKLTSWAALSFAPFLVNYVVISAAFARRRDCFEHSWTILLAFSLWTLCAISDGFVAHGVYDAPYSFAFGYLGFLAAFSVLLVRQFTASLDRLEAGNEELGLIVEERTAALHRKELQVAHGARMATVGTLSAGLAREIREPLGEVARRIDAVADDFGTRDPAWIEAKVADARRGIERIRSIVSELLHVARRDGGDMGPVDVNHVVRSVLPIVRHEARHRARLKIDLGDVPAIEGDEQLVSQILLSLVLNGIQAVPPGPPEHGSVTITTACDGDMVRLCVRDTGPGIPDEIRAHVFEPFLTTKPRGEGAGLGLAVAHQLVERHRGRIAMETGDGGTTVIVDLPVRSDAPGEQG